jgi:hypothetical protein
MGQEVKQMQVGLDLTKLMLDSQNKAVLMRTMAENADEEVRRLCQRLAEVFGLSAQLIGELKRSRGSRSN